MENTVSLSKAAEKDLKKIPRYILILFDLWVEIIETEGYLAMQKIRGYRDHSLTGERRGQRSSSLNRRWRIIYQLDEQTNSLTIEVLEVNHHDY